MQHEAGPIADPVATLLAKVNTLTVELADLRREQRAFGRRAETACTAAYALVLAGDPAGAVAASAAVMLALGAPTDLSGSPGAPPASPPSADP